jgi:hypothetical protein
MLGKWTVGFCASNSGGACESRRENVELPTLTFSNNLDTFPRCLELPIGRYPDLADSGVQAYELQGATTFNSIRICSTFAACRKD